MNRETPETMTATEVAQIIGTTPRKVILSILNGTMPIGAAQAPVNGEGCYNCTIIKERLDKWLKGEL